MSEFLPTTVVGSYPQPEWLIDRTKLGSKVPRVREPEIWRIPEALLAEAQDDATLLAIRAQERAGHAAQGAAAQGTSMQGASEQSSSAASSAQASPRGASPKADS